MDSVKEFEESFKKNRKFFQAIKQDLGGNVAQKIMIANQLLKNQKTFEDLDN